MNYYLAIDAGGTKADYLLADETSVLARARGATIKRMRVDAATATQNLREGLRLLTESSGVPLQAVTHTCIGTAGESVALVADWLREAHRQHVGGELLLLGDVEIALDAAFPGEGGVVVIAGTGSNVAGRTGDGKVTTAGGWGPAIGDQGSGYWIGLKALRAAFLALDEGRSTALLEAIRDYWQLATREELIAFGNSSPAPDFSQLTATVLRCAKAEDQVALAVLRSEGAELGYLARLVMRRLRAAATDPAWTPPLAFAGSILQNVLPVREALMASVREEFPEAVELPGVIDPIDGALNRARRGR
jgi:N-acetylglucosamine kinase-like BadF-type ATPase